MTVQFSDDYGENTEPRTLRITATANNAHGVVQSTQVLILTITYD